MNNVIFSFVPKHSLNISTFHFEKSNLHLTDLFIENISNDLALKINNSFFIIIDSYLHSERMVLRQIKGNFYNILLQASSSTLIFNGLEIKDFLLTDEFIFILITKTSDNEVNNKSCIYFNKILITQIFGNFTFEIVKGQEEIDQFYLKNSKFTFIQAKNLFYFMESIQFFYMENSIFLKNFVEANIHTKCSSNILIQNVTCLNNNKRNSFLNYFGGSCFKFYQSREIKIEKIKLINCVSFISSILMLETIVGNSINDTKIFINQGVFINNIIQIRENSKEIGGALKIVSHGKTFLEDSIFEKNKLEASKSIAAYGPCANIISKSLVVVNNSLFRENKSSKLSNCIYCLSPEMNIVRSFFLNNSISFLTESDYYFLNITANNGEEFFDVVNLKGGAVYFEGEKIIVTRSFFLDNKSNRGSAIYVNYKGSDNILSCAISIEKSFFIHNQALYASLIHLYIISYFEFTLSNSILSGNVAYEGGIMQIKTRYSALITISSNFFLENYAHRSPVFHLSFAPVILIGKGNLFFKNVARTTSVEMGAGVYTLIMQVTAFLENEKYYKNHGFQGTIILWTSKIFEYNSIYMGNICTTISGVAISNAATYIAKGIKFLFNYSKQFGCISSLDASSIYIEDSLFFNISSKQRSACIIIWDGTNITAINNLFALHAYNLIEIDSSDKSIFLNCSFFKNSPPARIFDIMRSIVLIEGSHFIYNNGSILSLTQNSKLDFKHVNITNFKSYDHVINVENSFTKFESTYFYSCQSKSSLISIFNTIFFSERNIVKGVLVDENGAYMSSDSSQVFVNELQIFDTIDNCFFLYKSVVEIHNSLYLLNNLAQMKEKENYGTIYSSGSSLLINKTKFLGVIQNITTIRFLYFINNPINVIIIECLFKNGSSTNDGGVAYIADSSVSFQKCLLTNNHAIRGGAIFFISKG